MARLTRGEFLGLGAALAGGFSAGCRASDLSPAAAAQTTSATVATEPDLIVINARVYTVDNANPRAEAFAIKHGRFVAVGSTADVKNLANAKTRVIDAGQMTVTPGFIDTHCHVSGVNELYSVNANVRRVRELVANLRTKADKTPAGTWVSAFMFDDTKLDVPLTRRHLDEASTDHPIVVNHRGGHTSWYNSKALALAGITRNTPDPDHGRFSATKPASSPAGSPSWRATCSTQSAPARPSRPSSSASAGATVCVTSRSC